MKKIYSLIIASCFMIDMNSQVFSNNTVSGCNAWDSNNSWATALTKSVAVSGLPTTLASGGIVLKQVNVKLGNTTCKGNLSSYWIRLISPTGVIDTITSPVTTSITSMWVDVKFRDHYALERIRDYSPTTQQSYFPFNIGYYKSNKTGSYSRFNNSGNPNGNWDVQIIENTASEVSVENVELVFGPAISINDLTGSTTNDNCSGAACIKNNEITIGTNLGFANGDPNYPGNTIAGCSWNGANNNSAWFQFVAGATTANITLSGLLHPGSPTSNKVQAIVIQAPASCATVPSAVPSGGCPTSSANNTSYLATNGGGTSAFGNIYTSGIIANMEFNLSGLTPCQKYYLYVDGEGGDTSTFYLEYTNGSNGGTTTTVMNPSCSINNGKIKINTPCSNSMYMWSSNANTGNVDSATNLGPGTYSVTVSNGGCFVFDTTITLTKDSIKFSSNITQPNCANTQGKIKVNMVSTGSTSYVWSSNASTGNIDSAVNLSGGTYKVTLTQNGCTDSATFTLSTPAPPASDSISLQSCGNITYNSKIYTKDTSFLDTIKSKKNILCDSLIKKINIKIKTVLTSVFQKCILTSDSVLFNGVYLKTSGTYKDTFLSISNCDSIVTLNLSVSSPMASSKDSLGCISIMWKGNTYAKDTFFNDTIRTTLGCDSLYHTFQLKVFGPTTVNNPAVVGCDTVVYKTKKYSQNTTVSDTLKKSVSPFCDSLYQITPILVTKSDTTKQSNCINSGNTFNFYGTILNSSGIYYKKWTNKKGCDSIIHLTLTVILPSTVSSVTKGCGTILYQSKTYTKDTILKDTVKSALGCDSIYRLDTLIVSNPTIVNNLVIVGCDTVLYKSKKYSQNTIVTDTVKKTVSPFCDSLYQVTPIQINQSDTTPQSNCINSGKTFNFYGTFLNSSGIYYKKWTNKKGCDSIIKLTLRVIAPAIVNSRDSACYQFSFKGKTYTTNTILTDTIKSSLGCDSLFNTTQWTVFSPNTGKNDTLSGCDSVLFKNNTYYANTTLKDTLKKLLSPFCDSIYKNIIIIVHPKPIAKIIATPDTIIDQNGTISLSASGGVSYQWNKEGGTQQSFLTMVTDRTYFEVKTTDGNGCIDTAYIWLTIYPEIEIPTVFSPNDDNINESIGPVIKGDVYIASYKIFNRWGQIVFEGEGKNIYWNGRFKGDLQPQGTYVYTLEYIIGGKTINKIGSLTLIH